MPGSEPNQHQRRFMNVMTASVHLMQRNENEEALHMLDEAIEAATAVKENMWVLTLCHHAAVISRFQGNMLRVSHYYKQSLAMNPDNPRALEGLADAAKEQGDLELAKQYAARCYKVLTESNDVFKKQRLETLLTKWPEVAEG
jgi:Tfp pilus assembly protein PilF